MTQLPLFGVDKRYRNAPKRAKWLLDFFQCSGVHISDDEEVWHNLWNWTEAIERIVYAPGIVTIYWSDSTAIDRFDSFYAALLNRLSDCALLEHIAMDEISDDDRTLREVNDLP